jgi:hypothetical protein
LLLEAESTLAVVSSEVSAEHRQKWPGTREKVRSRRINLEGNTHSQEINVSQCPV